MVLQKHKINILDLVLVLVSFLQIINIDWSDKVIFSEKLFSRKRREYDIM